MTVTLPTQKKRPSDNFQDYVYFIAGEKKIGKTAFAAQWPDAFILEMEPGNAKHLECNYEDVHNWQEYLQFRNLLDSNRGYCKTLVVDDVTSWYNYLLKYIEQNVVKVGPEENIGFGGWKYAKNVFTEEVHKLRQLGVGLVFTNHTEIKTVEDLKGNQISTLDTTMGNQCKEIMDGISHFVGIMLRDATGARQLYIEGTSFIKCGHGFNNHFLNGETGEPLAYIEMGKSAEIAFNNFIAAFHNSYIPPKSPIMKPMQNVEGHQIPTPVATRPIKITDKK